MFPVGWDSTRHRVGGGAGTVPFDRGDRSQARPAVPSFDRRFPNRAASPADASLAHRLELRPAARFGEAAAAALIDIRRGVDVGSGGANLQRRGSGTTSSVRSADLTRGQELGRGGAEPRTFSLPAAGDGAAVYAREALGTRWRCGGSGTASALLPGTGGGDGAEAPWCGTGRMAQSSGRGARQPTRSIGVESRRGGI